MEVVVLEVGMPNAGLGEVGLEMRLGERKRAVISKVHTSRA